MNLRTATTQTSNTLTAHTVARAESVNEDRDQRLAHLVNHVQRIISSTENPHELTPKNIADLIRREAPSVMSDVDVLHVMRKLRSDSTGIGILEDLLRIDGITDIVVNGPNSVWFDCGAGLEQSTIRFNSETQVRQLATRLMVTAGRRLDDAQCYADGKIQPDSGHQLRIHAVLSPPAEGGTCISIRVLRQAEATIEGLEHSGTFDAHTAEILRVLVAARRSFLVVGGTGSGKTTLLSALLAEVSARERIVCLEDTSELKPNHPHAITLVTRGANTEGQGEITMSVLLKQALRMRPDRIVVGEIRGAEVVDLLAALNTGHEGCAGTVHANSIYEVPARLEALAATGGMPRQALLSQLAAARPVVLVMRRMDGKRVLWQIGAIESSRAQVKILWEKDSPHYTGHNLHQIGSWQRSEEEHR
ncbi:TadA family conjugal transfer-associated ATPase [Corynebacterium felinum]|uniref:Pilus assembly protein CpaF n=1 Tax=Corynebacterium felinum TaxID=131318 RepID=A0ABU2B661_9CORY|nr:TadA family conjugal transfer-associated ATPase [Corynebacterium felinum]MDF5820658.1 TadA family conjugal transfer-associated ATPase [Corynebacterium felinum]MDR7354097.1 pilus assembly protein CpaF [Corynebacterium felinum]WJY96269.1 Putative conjugal transfer protein [Corynebacterium felinum]